MQPHFRLFDTKADTGNVSDAGSNSRQVSEVAGANTAEVSTTNSSEESSPQSTERTINSNSAPASPSVTNPSPNSVLNEVLPGASSVPILGEIVPTCNEEAKTTQIEQYNRAVQQENDRHALALLHLQEGSLLSGLATTLGIDDSFSEENSQHESILSSLKAQLDASLRQIAC